MTNKEAIARIKDHKIVHKMNEPRAILISEALDIAIKALEQEPCDDAISRQAALDYIHRILNQGTGKKKSFEFIQKYVEKLPSVNPQESKWIPVSERLPKKEEKTYWVCTDTEYQCECRWTNNRFGLGEGEWGWSIFDTPQYSKPIAWMPLPEPYKAESEDKE